MRKSSLNIRSLLVLLLASLAVAAHADTVQANAVIYYPFDNVAAGHAGGTVPGSTSVIGIVSLTFSVTGAITLNSYNYNDPDGNFAAVTASSNTGTPSYGGIFAPGAGYLTGLFVGSSTTPGAATYYTATTITQTSFSPTLNQVFFIGDGLTGDDTGTTQTFFVPTGATDLYLGISDSYSYNGPPSSYQDNLGSYNVAITKTPSFATSPEPPSLLLLATGVLGTLGTAIRRGREGRLNRGPLTRSSPVSSAA